ncbi:MAG: hypothetical protein GSR82_00560, partial [Desulfurococcales archaeon]|nr:hypothetical protein [Desulfurococcales archaeon]
MFCGLLKGRRIDPVLADNKPMVTVTAGSTSSNRESSKATGIITRTAPSLVASIARIIVDIEYNANTNQLLRPGPNKAPATLLDNPLTTNPLETSRNNMITDRDL